MGLMTFLNGCATPSVEAYKKTTPPLNLKTYFTGSIKAWGLIQNRSGVVTRRFDVTMNGSWEGDVGTLEEQFQYYDGETQKRVWTIAKTADNRYVGKAADILDQATGELEGSAMRWAYQMDLPVGDTTYRITFDDWMFLMNDGVLINRSYLKKFGITVAELTLFMQKQD
ncbi:MAG: DUF3833 domain-containing protein [Methylophilaceae bacterium]|nr:DUF3833 domain-containing protein [Methylophilaceae bacterium]MDG1445214.1 DUF3833 domain-containing protein [Methylophilaceae bacterium]